MYCDKYKPFFKYFGLFVIYSIIVLAVIYIFSLINNIYDIGLVCAFREVTGLYCSGCGMTRATLSLAKMDFYQAFRYNAFSVILLPALFLYFYGEIYAYIFKKKNFMNGKVTIMFWIILIALMVIYGVLRNIPYFSFLAPTTIS